MPELLSLLALLAIAWYWYDSLKVRETAIRTTRSACEADGLQLLDDTVALTSLRPVRNDEGRLVPRRVYAFEYSDTGDNTPRSGLLLWRLTFRLCRNYNRRRGSIVMVGQRATVLNIGLRLVPGGRMLH